jgi:uncharacterized protein YqfA (UPF0365 family)
VADKFQQHRGFDDSYINWQPQPHQQSGELTFDRSEALDLAGRAVSGSFDFEMTPRAAEAVINPEIQEMIDDGEEVRAMRREHLEMEGAL